jgi:hypothetical protein
VDTPGCFYGWDLFLVFISMSANLQPIPLGLIAIQPYLDFVTVDGSFIEDEGNTVSVLQNDAFVNPPSVFIDGILLTYVVSTDRRYVEFDANLRRIIIRNGIIQLGEYVQIFL